MVGGTDRARASAERMPPPGDEPPRRSGRIARSTAFFAAATGLSRVAGLVREIFAASYFGIGPQMSAFTIAFQVPNLVLLAKGMDGSVTPPTGRPAGNPRGRVRRGDRYRALGDVRSLLPVSCAAP